MEFKKQQLILAEAILSEDSIKIEKIQKISLPEEAIERGVPSDPEKMSGLITSLCQENNIYARRTAVVLPTDSAFTKLVYLPGDLDLEEARNYANSPSSGFQIPIPLDQSDFDLIPTELPSKFVANKEQRPYFLTSVPKKLIDKLIETLKLSDLELREVEVAFTSQLNFILDNISDLKNNEFIINLELLNDNSHLTIITSSGPIATERISSIREFPEKELNKKELDALSFNEISAEELIYKDENYLPISSLDIQTLLRDSQGILRSYKDLLYNYKLKKLFLSGQNSAHKDIDKIISEKLKKDVEIIRPITNTCFSNLEFSDLFVYQSLNRLFGIAIGLIKNNKSSTKNNINKKGISPSQKNMLSNKAYEKEDQSKFKQENIPSLEKNDQSELPNPENKLNLQLTQNSINTSSETSIEEKEDKSKSDQENISSLDKETESIISDDKKNNYNSGLGELKFSNEDD